MAHLVAKDERAASRRSIRSAAEHVYESASVEDVVTKHQARRAAVKELLADEECLGKSSRLRLHPVRQGDSPAAPVAKKTLEGKLVQSGGMVVKRELISNDYYRPEVKQIFINAVQWAAPK